eukprot:UN3488
MLRQRRPSRSCCLTGSRRSTGRAGIWAWRLPSFGPPPRICSRPSRTGAWSSGVPCRRSSHSMRVLPAIAAICLLAAITVQQSTELADSLALLVCCQNGQEYRSFWLCFSVMAAACWPL